jgi:PKD repeat protein
MPMATDTVIVPDLVELSGPSGEFDFFPDTVGCPPYDITFTSEAENVNIYTWDFGDGFLGLGETTTHTYSQIGSYIPTLILEDNNGCTFSYQSQDTLHIEPLAVDAGLSASICQFDTVQLVAIGGDAYSWFPPTGLSDSNVASPMANPDVTTEYVVTVNLGLCQNTDTVTVFVNPTPVVNFVGTNDCFGSVTQFSDFSSISALDSITSWNWDLAQQASSDTNPSLVYNAPGTYDVSLMLESSTGCTGFGTGSVVVYPSPTANFMANDTCLFEPTFLTDLSTIDNGTITNWNWQFGNGSTSLEQHPFLTYFEDSVYQITLVVTATGGCTDTINQTTEIYPLPIALVTVDNVCLGETVQFGDSSTINSGSIVQWDWDFGDGNSSSNQHPGHSYSNAQNYVYALTVTSEQGCIDATSSTVTTYPNPMSQFEMTSTTSCFSPTSVNLFNQASGGNQFQWNHDNGTISTGFNSTAIFNTIGQYNIELLVTNQFGCQDSSTQLFEVFPTVIANFETSLPNGCEPWSVDFTNLSENSTSFNWDFSDAPGSATADPTHIFEDSGTYSVQLIVEGAGGCADTVVYNNLVTVWPNPTALFEYQNISQEGIANGTVAFLNTSSPHVGTWWEFGNGETSTSENTTYQYDFYGNKLVTLAIVDANGCVDTLEMYVSVNFFGGLYVPNAIIPQDPNPEVRIFQPVGTGLGFYRCLIYDKWGNRLWESNKLVDGSPAEYWDGIYQGKLVPQGAYIWKIDAIFANGNSWEGMENINGEFHESGTVTVIR